MRDPFATLPGWAQYALVALVAGAVYWALLGHSPFALSEGHRVIPAWEMLGGGDWLIPRLFDHPYLRKPPGLAWAIAGATAMLGPTEFAARSVSALAASLSSLLACGFSRRWWGPSTGARAGLMHALTPLFWYPGRSAEIESLHNFATLVTTLLVIDVLLSDSRRRAWGRGLLAGLGLLAMLAAKGPAGLPCVAGAVGACMIVRRSWRLPVCVPLWLGALVAACGVGAYTLALAPRLGGLDHVPIVQSPAGFLWRADRLALIAALAPWSLATAVPASLGLIPAMVRPSAGRAPAGSDHALAAALAVLLALGLYTLGGVSNARYAMPALVLCPILTGYAAAWWPAVRDGSRERRIGLPLLLDHPWIPPVLLLIGAGIFIAWSEPRRERISGRDEGVRFAASLPEGRTLIWADKLVEARPEFFLYARRAAAAEGRTLDVRWFPQDRKAPLLPPPGSLIAIRDDDATIRDDFERESETFARLRSPILREVFRGRIHKFTFTVQEVSAGRP